MNRQILYWSPRGFANEYTRYAYDPDNLAHMRTVERYLSVAGSDPDAAARLTGPTARRGKYTPIEDSPWHNG